MPGKTSYRTAILLVLAMASCSGSGATLNVMQPPRASGAVAVDHSISFGGGPITAQGEAVTIEGDPSWSEAAGVGSLGLVFINPDENHGQEPGIVIDQPNQFQKTHRGRGLVLKPGERWFFVLSAVGRVPGRWSMGSVSLTYRGPQGLKSITIPTNMTVEVTAT